MLLFFIIPALLAAQVPTIGQVDFYGLRTIREEQVRAKLQVQEGQPLPRSKGDVEAEIESIPGVVFSRLEAVCCEGGKAILYVGIEEKGAPHYDYLPAPTGPVQIPEDVHEAYARFLDAVSVAARSTNLGEELSAGHSLMTDPEARTRQLAFVDLAARHGSTLIKVLHESADEEARAIAAYVLGYSPDKRAVVNELQSAMRDPNDTVRSNAARALAAIAVLASRQPDDISPRERIQVSPTWFIEMLDSLVFADRLTATAALVTMTEHRPADVLERLKERAIPALSEMARWRHQAHALPAFILLGRTAGMAEPEIQNAWTQPDRSAYFARVLPQSKKR